MNSLVIASEAKQSIDPLVALDCFVAIAPRNDEQLFDILNRNAAGM